MCIILYKPSSNRQGDVRGNPRGPVIDRKLWDKLVALNCGSAGIVYPGEEIVIIEKWTCRDTDSAYAQYVRLDNEGLDCVIHLRGHDGMDLDNAQPNYVRGSDNGLALCHNGGFYRGQYPIPVGKSDSRALAENVWEFGQRINADGSGFYNLDGSAVTPLPDYFNHDFGNIVMMDADGHVAALSHQGDHFQGWERGLWSEGVWFSNHTTHGGQMYGTYFTDGPRNGW